MYSLILSILTVLVISGTPAIGQDLKFVPKYATIIDTSKGRNILNQCSRSVPKNISGFWQISQSDLNILEDYFKKIYTIKAKDCCRLNFKLDDLTSSAYQFIGVFINGQKHIYCNAFRIDSTRNINSDFKNWQTEPVVICYGGYYFWGVLFNMKNKKFKNLAFNGE
jgi:hypothetical protein